MSLSIPSKFNFFNFICENVIHYYLPTDIMYMLVGLEESVAMAEVQISEARKFSVPSDVIKSLDSKAAQLLPKTTSQ